MTCEQNTSTANLPGARASQSAFHFVLTMGLVNLFADVTYEGGAAINGPYLKTLGARAAAVSIIAGAGEFLGYALRSISGYVSDKTGKYWSITFAGYVVNLLAVPAMALAGNWWLAAALVLAERIGRAMRKPTVEAMLSYTTGKLGKGWVYALNTALDETGATLGPLLIALVLWMHGSFRTGYATLLISTVLALSALTAARVVFPLPSRLEEGRTAPAQSFTRAYWLYMLAGSCFAAGLMSFELISYHFATTGVVAGRWSPVFLALSTGAGVFASLALGKLYDRKGIIVVLSAVFISSLFAPLVFYGSFFVVLAGMILWGVGYATQDTLLKALVSSVLPEGKRNLAFGLFYVGYGAGWLVGSIVTGLLYEHSHVALIVFSVLVQLVSAPIFLLGDRAGRSVQRQTARSPRRH